MGSKKAGPSLRIREDEADSLMTPRWDEYLPSPRVHTIIPRRWTLRRTVSALALVVLLAIALHVVGARRAVSRLAYGKTNHEDGVTDAPSPADAEYPRPTDYSPTPGAESYLYNLYSPDPNYPATETLPASRPSSLTTSATTTAAYQPLDHDILSDPDQGDDVDLWSGDAKVGNGILPEWDQDDPLTEEQKEKQEEPTEEVIEPFEDDEDAATSAPDSSIGMDHSDVGYSPSADHGSLDGLKPPQKPKARRALIISSYRGQRLDWMKYLAKDWEVYRYVMDNPDAKYHVPGQGGREAMTYLTWILNHYNDLPDYAVFIHGHRRSWHAPEPVGLKLESLNFTALDQDQYISFRCQHNPTCHPKDPINLQKLGERPGYTDIIPKLWKYTELTLGPLPTKLSSPCCAQFAVTKAAILGRSKFWWDRYRKPLFGRIPDLKQDNFDWGMTYEKLWHVAFGMDPFYCPSITYCFNVQWSMGVLCSGYPAVPLWGHWGDWAEVSGIECFKNTNNTKHWVYKQWTINNITEDKQSEDKDKEARQNHPRNFGDSGARAQALLERDEFDDYKYAL